MVYFRSFLAGLAATLIAEILLNIAVIAILSMSVKQPPARSGTGFVFVGWDPVSFARTAPGCILLLLPFAAGFFWQYRRLAAH